MKNHNFVLAFIITTISCFIGQYSDQQNINVFEVTTSLLIGLVVTLFAYYIHHQNITKN